jgi:hypothetical protein
MCSFRRSLHKLRELIESIRRSEAIALEDDFDFEILEFVEWMAIAISAFFKFGHSLGARFDLWHGFFPPFEAFRWRWIGENVGLSG